MIPVYKMKTIELTEKEFRCLKHIYENWLSRRGATYYFDDERLEKQERINLGEKFENEK